MPRNYKTVKELYYRVVGKTTKSAISADPSLAWHTYLQRIARRMERGTTDAEIRQQAAHDGGLLIVSTRVQFVRQVGWKQASAEKGGRDGDGRWALADSQAGQRLIALKPAATKAKLFKSEDDALEECERQRRAQNSNNIKITPLQRTGAAGPECWMIVNRGIAYLDSGKAAMCLLEDGTFGIRYIDSDIRSGT